MTFPCAPVRLLLSSLVFLGLGSSLYAQSLPQALSEEDILALNRQFADSVAVIAGDQVITRSDMAGQLRSSVWQERLREAADLPEGQIQDATIRVREEAAAELVEAFLEIQAGQDRGFDPEIVEILVERRFQDNLKQQGGYQAFYRNLKRGNSSPEAYRESIRNSLYRHSWRGATTGQQPGTTGRKELNRYVRPGEIRGAYKSFSKSPRLAEIELTGFREAEYEFLEIALGFEAIGGREAALERAQTYYERLSTGTITLEGLIEHWSKADKGLQGDSRTTLNLSQVAYASKTRFGGRALLDFMTGSEVGKLSKPLETANSVHLFQLTKIYPEQPIKPFADLEIQSEIRKHLAEKQGRIRLGRAHIRLIRESQVRPSELARLMLFLAQESMDR